MKNTVVKLSEMLVPYVNSLHNESANIKFHGGDQPKTYQDRATLNAFEAKIAAMSDANISELIIAAKEKLATCPYPINRECYQVVIKTCQVELRGRKLATENTMEK